MRWWASATAAAPKWPRSRASGWRRRRPAPLLAQCPASIECRLHVASQVKRHRLFIREVVKAHVAAVPKRPRTPHYHDDGPFTLSGAALSRRGLFKPEML
ncbi:flavin reductase [Bacillus subtilis subsp. subtilis]|nr:flavin reductase [Bacillus subtilis subsp. subtilis]